MKTKAGKKYYPETKDYLGGLVVTNNGIIQNCSFSGNVIGNYTAIGNDYGKPDHRNYIGGIVGLTTGTLTNGYYLDSCGFAGDGTSVSSGDLKNLNINIGTYFTSDIHNINNGYPILRWQ